MSRDLGVRPSRGRLLLFASADFGFNLYWQSLMMFLLFYYTDSLGVGIALASTIYLVASVWDGIASLLVGVAADRRGGARLYRRALVLGAAPLGIAFIAAYWPIDPAGRWAAALLLAGHLALRTAYAMVNVPYLAMTARISADPGDRAFVSGARMIAGTLAAILVSLATVPLGSAIAGPAMAYPAAAGLFAIVASVLLVVVGLTYRDAPGVPVPPPMRLRPILAALAANRAFVRLALAMMAMIVAVTMVGKSVLYYFKYFIHDEGAGRLALAQMMATGLVAVPLWMAVARWRSVRFVWVASTSLCVALMIVFAIADLHRAGTMQLFLVGFHAAVMGMNFAVWALLPEAVDAGTGPTGERVEASLFGVTALLQRIAIGIATAILGWGFANAGYEPNMVQGEATLTRIRTLLTLVPIALFLASAALVATTPRRAPGA